MKTVSTQPRKSPEAATFAVIVLAVLLGLWVWRVSRTPQVILPVPPMPARNAFNVFNAAANAEVQPQAVDYAATARPLTPPPSLAVEAGLVAVNATALRRLSQGLPLTYQNPPVRSLMANTSYYEKFRQLGRLLKVEGQVRQADGDWAGASRAALDDIQMGLMIPHGSSVIGTLSGEACQAEGRSLLWLDVSHLSAGECHAATRRLESLQTLQVPYSATLQEEEWEGEANLGQILRAPNWYLALCQDIVSNHGMGFSRGQSVRVLMTGKEGILRDYTRQMAQEIHAASLPYATASASPALPSDPMTALMVPDFRPGQFRITADETENVLLTVTLALGSYRLQHGAYPPTLSALVPRYPAHVPDDPFALSGPVRYKIMGGKYVLYSVGPDGIDDGGKPIFDTAKPAAMSGEGDRRYWVTQSSQGDIVAGINLE